MARTQEEDEAAAALRARAFIAADALARARRSGKLLDALPAEAGPIDLAAALAIQRARTGRKIGGWKCALPRGDRLVLAPLDRPSIIEAPGPVRVMIPAVWYEPELAFRLARGLPARPGGYDRAGVLAAVDEVRLGIELLHGRFARPETAPFYEMLADDCLHEGLVLGPRVACEPPDAILVRDGAGERTLPASHAAADPAAPLVWLANHLSARGEPLEAGMTIITGSFTRPQRVTEDTEARIVYRGMGEVTIRLLFKRAA